jgi:hypothetical protein
MFKMLTDELDPPEVQRALNAGFVLVSIDEARQLADEDFEFPNLDHVTGREMRLAQWSQIHRQLVARFDAEAKDRTGQSMRLAAALRASIAQAKTVQAVDQLRQQTRAFDQRSDWLFRFGYLQTRIEPCEKYVALACQKAQVRIQCHDRHQPAPWEKPAPRFHPRKLFAEQSAG